jgi:hypothetical protein
VTAFDFLLAVPAGRREWFELTLNDQAELLRVQSQDGRVVPVGRFWCWATAAGALPELTAGMLRATRSMAAQLAA